MNDIVSLDRHPVLMQAYEVCQAIEECGCSEELTAAVIIKASDLLGALKSIVVEIEQYRSALEFYAYEFQWSDESDDKGSTARATLQEFETTKDKDGAP